MSDFLSKLEEQDRQHRLKMQQHNEKQERLRQDPKFIAESERRRTLEDQGWENMVLCFRYAMRVKELAGGKDFYVNKQDRGRYSDLPQQIEVHKHNSDRRFQILYESSEPRLKVTCTSDVVYSETNRKTYTKQMYFAVNELNENEMGKLMEWALLNNDLYFASGGWHIEGHLFNRAVACSSLACDERIGRGSSADGGFSLTGLRYGGGYILPHILIAIAFYGVISRVSCDSHRGGGSMLLVFKRVKKLRRLNPVKKTSAAMDSCYVTVKLCRACRMLCVVNSACSGSSFTRIDLA